MRKIKRGRRRARRLLPRRRGRLGLVLLIAGAGIAAVASIAALIDGRRGGDLGSGLVEYAQDSRADPVRLVASAARRHQIIFLGDILSAPEPKRIAADAIDALAHGPGLDAVVLEIGSDLQGRIDRYLETEPEDIGILLSDPRTTNERWGVANEYLEIYRRVWRLNRTLDPGRRIRILAVDLPGWPPAANVPPRLAAAQYAQRDSYMAERIESMILAGTPRARLLIFMAGLHGLKSGQAEVNYGTDAPVPVVWLGTRLRQLHPGEVYTIVTDGAFRSTPGTLVAGNTATRVYDFLRKRLPDASRPFALTVDGHFDFLTAPIRTVTPPGLEITLRPENYRLQDVADGYIYLGTGSGTAR